MLRTTQWISEPKKETSHVEILKRLQEKVKAIKPFKGMNEQQIIKKLHQERKKLLKENPHAYINYSA